MSLNTLVPPSANPVRSAKGCVWAKRRLSSWPRQSEMPVHGTKVLCWHRSQTGRGLTPGPPPPATTSACCSTAWRCANRARWQACRRSEGAARAVENLREANALTPSGSQRHSLPPRALCHRPARRLYGRLAAPCVPVRVKLPIAGRRFSPLPDVSSFIRPPVTRIFHRTTRCGVA